MPEPKLESLQTPFGKLIFVALVGATDAELQAIMQGQLRVRELYARLGTDVTDLQRGSLV